jgi:hypothetical protein
VSPHPSASISFQRGLSKDDAHPFPIRGGLNVWRQDEQIVAA